MDTEAFFYVFVHGQILAELGLHEELATWATEDVAAPEEPAIDVDLAGAFAGLDLSVFDGLDTLVDAEIARSADRVTAPPPDAASPDVLAASAPDEQAPPPSAVATHLAHAYARRAELRARVASAHRRIDAAALTQSLAALPDELAPLTGPLTATQLGEWLSLYGSGHDALHALVAEVRRTDG